MSLSRGRSTVLLPWGEGDERVGGRGGKGTQGSGMVGYGSTLASVPSYLLLWLMSLPEEESF